LAQLEQDWQIFWTGIIFIRPKTNLSINEIIVREALLKERSREILINLPENTDEEAIELLNIICQTPPN
jgi:hypothetical protein